MDKKPLFGVKVLDLTQFEAGPTATLYLAFLGAEVVKVERPNVGDPGRFSFSRRGEDSLYFILLNVGKKSITLDIKKEEGKKIFKRLIPHFDVLVENFSKETMESLGLGYSVLSKINPSLIYATCSGFGRSGPKSDFLSYDMVAQAESGVMSVTGWEDRPPLKCGFSIADASAGIHLALGIVSALYMRERTKKGCFLDISLQDATLALGRSILGTSIAFGEVARRWDNRIEGVVPYNVYKARCGRYVALCVVKDDEFERLLKVMGKEELISDPRCKTRIARVRNAKFIEDLIKDFFKKHDAETIVQIFRKNQIPCGLVMDSFDVENDSQLNFRGMILKTKSGKKILGSPIRFDGLDAKEELDYPKLSEHTFSLLKDLLGIDKKEFLELKRKGVL